MIRPDFPFVVVTASLLAIAYGLFSQGMGGGLYFDDMSNLAPLSQVRSWVSALQFVWSGTGGPSGRPLSLASFALQAEAWPNKPEAFIQVNILIHLLNGALVAWFSLFLANITGITRRILFVSLLTALWLLSPIQVSSVLFIVQRMTLLSGFFILLGLIFYLLGRTGLAEGKISWHWITLAFAMTIPATLSKENGVLLPGFLLILEYFLFNGKTNTRHSALPTKLLAVWASIILLLGLLFMYRYWPSFSEGFASKGYTLSQQVATEARIVVHYLSQFAMPNLPEFGPFHDDFPIADTWHTLGTLAAATALFLLAGLAWWARHRNLLFSAGVFFFLWGHTLESSVIPLELYFEHRNYIPILGLAMALTGIAVSMKSHHHYVIIGIFGLILLSSFCTYQYASIWGRRSAAAQYWYSERPQSVRAVLHFADQLGEQRRWTEADQLVSKAWRTNPHNMGFAMPMLYVACRSATEKLEPKAFSDLTTTMRTGHFTRTSALILHRVLNLVTSGQCAAFSLDDILTMLDALAKNPQYQVEAETVADFMIIRAKVLFAQGHALQSALLLSQTIGIDFRLSIALQAAKLFEDAGQHAKAVWIIQRARSQLPSIPWLRDRWLRDIEHTEATIARYSEHKSHTPQ